MIVVGDIKEDFLGTPIEVFEKAIDLSKEKNFCLHTNDAMFVEALEVLCGEKNISIFIKRGEKYTEVSFLVAYNYLGDVYDYVDKIRGIKIARGKITDDFLSKCVKDYEERWKKYE